MNASLIVSNILNPPILFFFLGMVAVLSNRILKFQLPSETVVPYLLFSIGFKRGGTNQSGIPGSGLDALSSYTNGLFCPYLHLFVLAEA